eukprot:1507365-Pleurochrysis_carterae.AAC.1
MQEGRLVKYCYIMQQRNLKQALWPTEATRKGFAGKETGVCRPPCDEARDERPNTALEGKYSSESRRTSLPAPSASMSITRLACDIAAGARCMLRSTSQRMLRSPARSALKGAGTDGPSAETKLHLQLCICVRTARVVHSYSAHCTRPRTSRTAEGVQAEAGGIAKEVH